MRPHLSASRPPTCSHKWRSPEVLAGDRAPALRLLLSIQSGRLARRSAFPVGLRPARCGGRAGRLPHSRAFVQLQTNRAQRGSRGRYGGRRLCRSAGQFRHLREALTPARRAASLAQVQFDVGLRIRSTSSTLNVKNSRSNNNMFPPSKVLPSYLLRSTNRSAAAGKIIGVPADPAADARDRGGVQAADRPNPHAVVDSSAAAAGHIEMA